MATPTADTHKTDAGAPPGRVARGLDALGQPVNALLGYIGQVGFMTAEVGHWVLHSIVLRRVRFGRPALYAQLVRIGVRSVGVVLLVCACIGLILALQMAPPLQDFGQVNSVANIISVAIFRELGPLITAIVLTGFAGASIAAEIGTMVVGEEIEALESMALHPVRFLVLPRVLATVLATLVLCVMGELVAVAAGWGIGVSLLGIPSRIYIDNTIDQIGPADFFTGLFKAGVFGAIVGLIGCTNGLNVTGGAAGVGKATTNTVVHSIVAIIFCDLIFTALFFQLGWT
ncbi:MAG: MlaE family lipid ABC transporter permease subunit [Phycisphaera sp.]|nr:MlaE family lipid ABC transporter permease subunit [Phycisphaera sp.]